MEGTKNRAISVELLKLALDRVPLSRVQWQVHILCIALCVLDGFDLQVLGLAVPLMSGEWGYPPGAFGVALASAVAGLGVGSMIFGALGDRVGRRWMLLVAAPFVGFSTLGVLTTTSLGQLIFWRFMTGLGFGMVLPNALALVADFMPKGRRVLGMTLLTAGMSAGAMIAGLVGPLLAGWADWRGMFLVGGIAPLLLWPVLYFCLEESPLFLARRRPNAPELPDLLLRLGLNEVDLTEAGPAKAPARDISTSVGGRRQGYLLVTAFYALTWMLATFTFYLLVSWMPTLVSIAGIEQSQAMRSVTFISGGGLVGGILCSLVIDKSARGFGMILALIFGLGAAVLLAFDILSPLIGLSLVALLIGGAIGGGSFLMPGISSRIYPREVLGTAIGGVTALSRLGAVLGPLAGGYLVSQGMSLASIFSLLGAVVALCSLSALFLHLCSGRGSAANRSTII